MAISTKLPSEVDVAIVGGGIIGVSAGYALAQAGVRVAVFEKNTLACEQSSRNWGWVRTLSRDIAEVPLALRANKIWSDIQSQVDVGFRRSGIVYLAENETDAEAYQHWLDAARACGADAVMLDRSRILERLPASNRNWTGALFSPTDGVAEPALATLGIAKLAISHGCRILEHCAVRGLDVSAGRVSGVITQHGLVKASTVLLAGGAWSRLFCGNSGVGFPQLKVRGSVLRTEPISTPLDLTVNGKDFVCRKRSDGGYTVSQFGASFADIVPDSFRLFRQFLPAWMQNNTFVKLRFGRRFFEELSIPRNFDVGSVTPFERHGVLDPKACDKAVGGALRKLAEAFPIFRDARVAQSWGGYIDVTPDALPVMSQVDAIPGFYLASGFSGHGFGIGPAAGEFMANMMQGKPLAADALPFNLARFS